MATKMSTPRGRIFKAKYLSEYNPYNPSVTLLEEFENTFLPKSGYLNKNTRGKPLSELTLDQLEWVAFELENGSEKLRFLAKLDFYIRLVQDGIEQSIMESEMETVFEMEAVHILSNIKLYGEAEYEDEKGDDAWKPTGIS